MTNGYIVFREDIVKNALDAISGGDVTFPYKGAYEYFKELVTINKPILIPKINVGSSIAPSYSINMISEEDEISAAVAFPVRGFLITATSATPNTFGVTET